MKESPGNTKWWLPVAISLLILLSSCAQRGFRMHPLASGLEPGTMLNAAGEPVPRESFLQRAAEADIILLGEGHTNPCDHQVQAEVLRGFSETGLSVALGLEMVPAGKQRVLDRFNGGGLLLDDLPKALDWPAIWGHSFSLYQPVLQAARESGFPVFGLNTSREIVGTLREKGLAGLAPDKRSRLPEKIISPPQPQKESLRQEFASHEAFVGEMDKAMAGLDRFFLIQALWDTQMARRALKVRQQTGLPVVILAGTGHVEFGWGVEHRVKRLAPQASTLSLVPWRGLEDLDPARGDFFFYCPIRHSSDLGYHLQLSTGGGLITEVEAGSLADASGLKKGDLIVKAGGKSFQGLMDLHSAAVEASRQGRPLELSVKRGSQLRKILLQLKEGGEEKDP